MPNNLVTSHQAVNVAQGYPIERLQNLGGEYIHSHWITFGQTASEIPNLKHNLKVLEQLIINIVADEVKFYEEAQKTYVEEVFPNIPNKKGSKEDTVIGHFRHIYKVNLSAEETDFGKLEIVKKGTMAKSRFNWTQKSWTELKKDSKTGMTLQKGLEEMKMVVAGISQYLQLISEKNNLNYLRGSKYGKEGDLPETLKKVSTPAKRKKYEDKLKTISNNIEQGKLGKKDINTIFKIIKELHIDSWSGLLAEEFQVRLLQDGLSSLLTEMQGAKFSPRVTGKDYWNFNITDVVFAEVETQGKKTEIGLSQKFRNYEKFDIDYVNLDIFHSLENHANKNIQKGDKKITNELEHMKNFFYFLRKNIMALSSWGIGQKIDSAFNVDEFVTLDERLAFARGFLRFFNGHVKVLESGEFSPFTSDKNLEKKMIFNAFLVSKKEIYWTLDFVKPILEMLQSSTHFNDMNKSWFKATIIKKSFPSVTKDMQNLIREKRRRIRELKKAGKEVKYTEISSDTEVRSLIDKIGKATGNLMIDKINYELDPNNFTK